MRSLIVKEPGVTQYTDEFDRPVCEDDQIVIKISRNGICATDMAILAGDAGFMHDGTTSYPVRFGHEYAGTVVEVGKDVKNFKVGDKAISEGGISCGKCPQCQKGHYDRCENLRSIGTIKTWPGSFAEYIAVPARHCFYIPDEISFDIAALMEPAAVGMMGVNKAHIIPGESIVLVTGVGGIGIAAAAFAKHRGAKKVLISGRTPYKLDIAKKMGVDACCNSREESLIDFVNRETDGHGVDCLIECSGNINVLNDCIDVLAEFGTLAVLAFYEKIYTTFDIDKFVMKKCVFESVMGGAQQDCIDAVMDGVDLSPLITRHVPFEEAGAFMEKLLTATTKEDIKVMVDFD